MSGRGAASLSRQLARCTSNGSLPVACPAAPQAPCQHNFCLKCFQVRTCRHAQTFPLLAGVWQHT